MDVENIATQAVDAGLRIHRDLGPGLYESVYEGVLASVLERKGFRVQRQLPISFSYEGVAFDEAFRADILVQGRLLIELKSTEKMAPIHAKQLLTYLRIMDLPLGLLMNFGQETFAAGLKRVANNHNAQT